MVTSCCAYGCSNRLGRPAGIVFYRFPAFPKTRRQKWIHTMREANWTPFKYTRLCGSHFVTGLLCQIVAYDVILWLLSTIIGKPDNRAGHVDCVPTLFVFNTTSTQPVQGVVTPIGPVLTSATAVKMVKTEIKEWSSGQGSLDPL